MQITYMAPLIPAYNTSITPDWPVHAFTISTPWGADNLIIYVYVYRYMFPGIQIASLVMQCQDIFFT